MKHSAGFVRLVNEARTGVRECSVERVKERLDKGDTFFLVDVREDSEWAAGHVPGAVHLGKGVIERDIEERISDPHADIVLYCGGGYRSVLAAESLLKMGYSNVTSMAGGYRDWTSSGFPVESD